ncbi:MAG: carbon-nitrogen hydrolase family protein [Candidatus Glassbacteria bacterium]|nr:carbon-nitrogen hydrolase family protein [Candidatus Glassbacteria bacterium]
MRHMLNMATVFLAALCLTGGLASISAAPPGKTKVAVIQATGSPRQDPFKAGYDSTKVRAMSQAHLDKLLGLIDRAGEMGADIVCGPEDMQHIGGYGLHVDRRDPETGEILFSGMAVEVPGPLSERIAAIARKHSMYVVAPIYEKENGKVYNSSLVFDRQGELIGRHRKTVLPIMETWLVTPGTGYEVFETDFAPIAISTCWEITYPEIHRIYALEGARLIFHPTMGRENSDGSLDTAHRYLTRATDDRVWLAPVILGTDGNGIISPTGEVLAEAVGARDTVIMAEIDFSERFLSKSTWWNTINGSNDNRAIHFLSRRPGIWGKLADLRPPLASEFESVRLTTGDREAQFEAVREVDYGP